MDDDFFHNSQVRVCRAMVTAVGKQIAQAMPNDLEFVLLVFDPTDTTKQIRGMTATGRIADNVKLLRYFADQMEKDAAALEERRDKMLETADRTVLVGGPLPNDEKETLQ